MTLDLIKIRRDLHQIPEMVLEEFKTQAYLLERICWNDWRQGLLWSNVLGVQGFLSIFTGMLLKKTIGLAYRYWWSPNRRGNRSWLQVYSWRSYACLWTRYAHWTTALWSFESRCFRYSLKITCFPLPAGWRKWSWWYAYVWGWCLWRLVARWVLWPPRPSRFQGRWYCD